MNGFSPFLLLGLLMTTGLLLSLFFSRLRVPRIASYALAGLLWSPGFLGYWLPAGNIGWSAPLTDMALAIVAYVIGGSMTVKQLRKLGKSIVLLTLGQVSGAFILVTLAIALLLAVTQSSQGWLLAIAMGVLAISTDPAATVAVIHQYRARGRLTTTLLGIAALDDAIGIVLFSLLLVSINSVDLGSHIANATVEVVGAVCVGSLLGYALASLGHRVKNSRFFLPMVLATLLLSQGLAELLHLSPLLTAMCAGFVARATFTSGGERLFACIEYLEELVFLIFYTLAGTHFDIQVFSAATDLVVVYVVARASGKIFGSSLAGRMAKAPLLVAKNAGIGAIPQAGIAIGMSLALLGYDEFREVGLVILNVILASTLIFELIGPFSARYALQCAGEIEAGKRS